MDTGWTTDQPHEQTLPSVTHLAPDVQTQMPEEAEPPADHGAASVPYGLVNFGCFPLPMERMVVPGVNGRGR